MRINLRGILWWVIGFICGVVVCVIGYEVYSEIVWYL